MHLWEVDHPYYMNEGNYYANGCHEEFDSFEDFLASWADADIDMNRVHRWDWREGDYWGIFTPEGDPDIRGELMVFFVLQRKARLMSCSVPVRRSDEPAVKEYLRPHFERELAIWSPFTPKD